MRSYSLNDEEIRVVNDLRLLLVEQRLTLFQIIHDLSSHRTPRLTVVPPVIVDNDPLAVVTRLL